MKRVLCTAIIDEPESKDQLFRVVKVSGAEAHAGIEREYKVVAKSDDEAAKIGMNLFVTEHGGDL